MVVVCCVLEVFVFCCADTMTVAAIDFMQQQPYAFVVLFVVLLCWNDVCCVVGCLLIGCCGVVGGELVACWLLLLPVSAAVIDSPHLLCRERPGWVGWGVRVPPLPPHPPGLEGEGEWGPHIYIYIVKFPI